MRFNLDISGFDDLIEELLALPEKANASIERTMNLVAQSTAQRAKQRIRTGNRSGRVYQLDGKTHQASAPGEPPANLSGRLATSITFTKMTNRPGSYATAGSDLAYAETLEFGGFSTFNGRDVYVEERPFLLPSFEEAIQGADIKLKAEFERSLR